jgi:hypothetical protein
MIERMVGRGIDFVEEKIVLARRESMPRKQKALPPLQNGDHLDQKTFHARYEAMPDVSAELMGGIVSMSPPMKKPHGRFGSLLYHWLGEFEAATPGTETLARGKRHPGAVKRTSA